MDAKVINKTPFVSTRNACKMCAPLGSSLAFKGVEGCTPLIHGSQGCSTYVRRYLISHFKEPVDIASSNFTQEATIFGGGTNLKLALDNVKSQYKPKIIGISTTCLSETIGDDVSSILMDYREIPGNENTAYVHAQTPSYQGSHADGFHEAIAALVKQFARRGEANGKTVLLGGLMSPADLRYLKEVMQVMQMPFVLLPDYSETMDNPHWDEYKLIPEGGTTMEEMEEMGSARAFIQFGEVLNKGRLAGRVSGTHHVVSAGDILQKEFSVPGYHIPFPIGIDNSDLFFDALKNISGREELPAEIAKERGRLIDAYVDGHKYIFGKKAMVYGEEDFVIALTGFLTEIGIDPVIIATGGESKLFEQRIREKTGTQNSIVLSGGDFEQMAEYARQIGLDLIVGHSKGYYIARELGIPMVRVGFPVHDRVGGQRLLHLGYRGTNQLFDTIVNAVIQQKQDNSPVGYKYM